MQEPYPHLMMPEATHDERARQALVASLKILMEDEVYPGSKKIYETQVLPRFLRDHNRAPKDRHEVRRAMERDGYTQTWSSIARTLQEMLWDNVGETVERQLPDLIERAKVDEPRGSLTLDPDLKIPRYVSAVDIHCMPGGYTTELTEDDVYAGALVDRGGYYYVLPLMGSRAYSFKDRPEASYRGAAGRNIIAYVQQEFPGLEVTRVLDMGCGIGGGTLPYKKEFPRAEVHGIDVGAPQLRYGHAQTERTEAVVHFSQQNAEHTNFPDGYFDLVVSHGLCHETSGKAVRNILKEAHRVLKPGGVTMHSDPQMGRGLDAHDSYMHDWDTYYNAEPFWGSLHDIPVADLMTTAGFPEDGVRDAWATIDDEKGTVIVPADDVTSTLYRSGIFGARKAG